MDKNQNCISALMEICNDFITYLNTLKEHGFISEAEYEQHAKIKKRFLETMKK